MLCSSLSHLCVCTLVHLFVTHLCAYKNGYVTYNNGFVTECYLIFYVGSEMLANNAVDSDGDNSALLTT